MNAAAQIGAVVIGRNEGKNLERCLASLAGQVAQIIYVDSGSTDGSVAAAQSAGAQVILLDTDRPFTAARARNVGLDSLVQGGDAPEFVQFIDGDCELRNAWLDTAFTFLDTHSEVAVACGRRRERHPDASRYNRLINAEWDTPIGETRACGGDALMRISALTKVGGFNPQLIAGEEPELCLRLRQTGWKIWRLDAEMTLHDANITRLGQWWQRARRAGHAAAEGAALHGAGPERYNVARTRRALLWGAGVPLATLIGALFTPWAWAALLLWPLQTLRLGLRNNDWNWAFFTTLGKIPEALGVAGYHARRLTGGRGGLIEYK